MKEKVLLFYINAIHEGGAERVILQLAKRFKDIGYKSIVVTSFFDENEYPVPDGVIRLSLENEQIIQSSIKRNISRIKSLRKIIKEYKPSGIISFMREANFRSIVASFGLKTKTIVSVRNDPNKEYPGKYAKVIWGNLFKFVDGVIFQTEDAKNWFPKIVQNKSRVILNTVDEKFFNNEISPGDEIVTLGRLTEAKNHKLLIDAFADIKDEFKDVNLSIYGIGELFDNLEIYIKQNELENRVFLKGLTDDSLSVLKKSKLFVLPSNHEGMPNALMEAMAVGVPCISTDCPCGGPKTLFKNGDEGILVPVGDRKQLAGALRILLSDEKESLKIANNARIRALDFKPEIVFKEWQEYIESVMFD